MLKTIFSLLVSILIISNAYAVQSTIMDTEGYACMGEDKTIPTVINTILFIPSRIGIFPILRFLEVSKLEQSIIRGKFQIVETETLYFDPTHDLPYIVARFIAARKV